MRQEYNLKTSGIWLATTVLVMLFCNVAESAPTISEYFLQTGKVENFDSKTIEPVITIHGSRIIGSYVWGIRGKTIQNKNGVDNEKSLPSVKPQSPNTRKATPTSIYEDAVEKLWPTTILGVANEKKNEWILYDPNFRYFEQTAIINNFWLEFEPLPYSRYSPRTEEVMSELVKDAFTEPLKFALQNQSRQLEARNLFRKWGKGMSSFRLDMPSSTNEFTFETPSYQRNLDPFEEAKSEARFECSNLKGDAAVIFDRKLRCSERQNEIAILESQIYTLRARPELDGNIYTASSGLTLVMWPNVNFKYRAYEIELSYFYPYTLTGGGSQPAKFLPDIRDKIFNERDVAERIQLDIQKTFTEHFVLAGNYRYESIAGQSTVGIGPKLFLFPYLAAVSGDLNVNTMKPFVTADMGRVVGASYILGVRGTALENNKKDKWEGQAFFTISKVWGAYPPETSFFKDIGLENIKRKLSHFLW
ncbi:MAG: hypothetical protein HYT12_02445 [Candidatus Liptonbacteria bacterium]|nr:hypothetical protein [Candidatus Liptonbacteria bacterium]